jgi:hypothetical protein
MGETKKISVAYLHCLTGAGTLMWGLSMSLKMMRIIRISSGRKLKARRHILHHP